MKALKGAVGDRPIVTQVPNVPPVPTGDPVELQAVADRIGATHPHVIRTGDGPTGEERRAALLELADIVDGEDRYPQSAPFSPVLRLLVPPLCGGSLRSDPVLALAVFEQLVGAVAERGRFVADESGYAANVELSRDAADLRTLSDVDCWADRLLGRMS